MQRLMVISAWIGGLFICISMAWMIYLGTNHVVVIEEKTASKRSMATDSHIEQPQVGRPIALQENPGLSGAGEKVLQVPTDSSLTADQLTVENRYLDHLLEITLAGADAALYDTEAISGDTGVVKAAAAQSRGEEVLLQLHLNGLYEYESTLENGYLEVKLFAPSDRYDKIVVLDLAMDENSSDTEAQILFELESELRQLLEKEGVRVYLLGGEQGSLSVEQKTMLARESGADLYLGVGLAKDSNPEMFGSFACFRPGYYIPWLSNSVYADLLERKLVTAISGRALGVAEKKDEVLGKMQIPAVLVYPGYASNAKELELMQQPSYVQKMAEGLRDGVLAALAGQR